ncbi:hypothetical protein ACS0M5_003401 [Escherichia coli]
MRHHGLSQAFQRVRQFFRQLLSQTLNGPPVGCYKKCRAVICSDTCGILYNRSGVHVFPCLFNHRGFLCMVCLPHLPQSADASRGWSGKPAQRLTERATL